MAVAELAVNSDVRGSYVWLHRVGSRLALELVLLENGGRHSCLPLSLSSAVTLEDAYDLACMGAGRDLLLGPLSSSGPGIQTRGFFVSKRGRVLRVD